MRLVPVTMRVEQAARVVAPAAVVLFAVVAAVAGRRGATPAAVLLVLVVVVSVALAVRLVRGWALVAGATVLLAAFTVLCAGAPGNVGWFGVCVLAGWCAYLAPVVPAVVFWVLCTVDLVVQAVTPDSDPGWTAWIAGTLFTTLACLMAQRQGVLLERLREAQAGLADQARSEERTRVAREMHDVIGHALTVTLLHIGTARLAVDDEPEVVRASLEEAERQARRSLEEVRASVGLLRAEPGALSPLPGGADLGELVESFRRTGAAVTCQVQGDPAGLPATTGLAAYRIVQEALTNAARHAPGCRTEVSVQVGGGRACVVVDSAGAPAGTAAQGNGLVGMRERAEGVGGRVTAGPGGHGWRVEAVLPT